MSFEGGCYCGALRYSADGDPAFKGECHCRECQYFACGGPNFILGLPADGFVYTSGIPKTFARPDLDNPVTREFCAECGTHILSRAPSAPGLVILKVGTLDDPSVFEGPQIVIQTADAQSWHLFPKGVPRFERFPG